MPSPPHTHKFVRVVGGTWATAKYLCNDPNCFASHPPRFLIGKMSRCTVCDEPFILTRWNLTKQAKPKCLACSDHKEARNWREIQEIVREFEKPSVMGKDEGEL